MTWKISDGRLDYLVVFVDVDGVPVPVGALTFQGKRSRQSFFTYARSWLSRPNRFALAPTGLPPRTRSIPSAPHETLLPFEDAAPDGWGRGVLQKAFPNQNFGIAEYLAASGDNRTGWFRFGRSPEDGPEQWIPDSAKIELSGTIDLDALTVAIEAADQGEPTKSDIMMLYRSSSDIGGARPKARIHHEGREWIAKFSTWGDRFDEPRVEALCLSLAKAAGIEVPAHKVISLGRKSVLLVERFDRGLAQQRKGYISAGTLLNSPASAYRTNFSYFDIAQGARTAGIEPCEDTLFQRLLFNAMIHNTDDHLRNHAFIGDRTSWRLSPVFDIVPQRHEHMVLSPLPGGGTTPDPIAILPTWRNFGINQERAEQIISDMADAFANIEEHLDRHEVSTRDREVLAPIMPHAFNFPAEMASIRRQALRP